MAARLGSAFIGSCLLLAVVPPDAWGQETRQVPSVSSAAPAQRLEGSLIDKMAVDRIREALLFLPGVIPVADGGLSLRGGRPEDASSYLDGVPISPGYRKADFGLTIPSMGQAFLELGTNAVDGVSVLMGPLAPKLGNGQAGTIMLETRKAGDRLRARGSFESDAPFGVSNGIGRQRYQALGTGTLGGRFTFVAAAVLEGLRSAESGKGAEDVPLLLPFGVDTTVGVPSAINDPFADTAFVDVVRFAVARGRCDAFSSSSNPEIADNYGADCDGVRLPFTSSNNLQLLGRLGYRLGDVTGLYLTAASSREQTRLADGQVFPGHFGARKGTSQVLTLGAHHALEFSGRPLRLSAALSFQRDRSIGGLLTGESEAETRDGFLLSSLEFMWDFESFPLDQELISNIRNNVPGTRRSPLDLENTSQYALVNRYSADSPYGLDGGAESGGPSGRITLLRESRTVLAGSAVWQPARAHDLEVGFELTRFSLGSYSHNLVSQAFSDAFIADPSRAALYIQDTYRSNNLSITGGVRYDRFRSDAERTFVLDTVSSSPFFNTYSPFPTPSSYGQGGITFNGQPLTRLAPDEARSAVSPRLLVALAPGARTILQLGVARIVQMPDLSAILSGVNTDLRVTNSSHAYGGDLDLERTTMYELAAGHQFTRTVTVRGAVYRKQLEDQATFLLRPFRDPARLGEQIDIRTATSLGVFKVTGAELSMRVQSGVLSSVFGYAYQKAETETEIPLPQSRPHTVTGIISAELPSDWRSGRLLGTILHNTGVHAGFRYTSGTAYTRCPAQAGNESVLSGDLCVQAFAGEPLGSRLPSFKQLDLRVTRSFSIAGRELVAYLDGRNILNFENVIAVFATTGQTSSPAEQSAVYQQDSASYQALGVANGISTGSGDLDLRYGGAVAAGCGNFVNPQFNPSTPDCVYLIRAEERFGDGDHIFTIAEQRRASSAAYEVGRGRNTFLGSPRRLRLGLEFRF
jgi:hypothetical protein